MHKIFLKVVTFILLPSLIYAGTLNQDNKAVEKKRQTLEEQRSSYENRLKKLSVRRQAMDKSLAQCFSKHWKSDWKPVIAASKTKNDDLKAQRLQLDQNRIELSQVRQELENHRVRIEENFKNKARGANYETQFRNYLKDFEVKYFQRIEAELFVGYQDYIIKFEKYLKFLENSTKECR